MIKGILVSALWWIGLAHLAWAGPPFTTDDPEPVEYQHWEVYLASQIAHDKDGWSGTSPHLEVNYGAVPNLQLHLIAPVSFVAPSHEAARFGYGDTELGVKYRFLEEIDHLPQIGTFPLVELPTGQRERGLGSGHAQTFLPLWLQKSFEPWTTYGGAGYWVNPGKGNRNWWYTGWLLQRELTEGLTAGAEIFHETSSEKDGRSDTKFNIGAIYDFSDFYHLLISAGHTVQGPNEFQAYIALQLT
ncbi:MAG TPA: transporter, partial [Candidatus Binatia bacterium]